MESTCSGWAAHAEWLVKTRGARERGEEGRPDASRTSAGCRNCFWTTNPLEILKRGNVLDLEQRCGAGRRWMDGWMGGASSSLRTKE